MKAPSIVIITVILWFCLALTCSSGFCKEPTTKQYLPHALLVKFHDGVKSQEKQVLRQSLGVQVIHTIRSIGVEYWRLPDDVSTEEVLDVLKDSPIVKHAEPNYLYKPQSIPDDTHFNKLWHLHNSGQTVNGKRGSPGADISATEAWDLETGSRNVVIAVIDTGVAFDHPDLQNNTWINVDEIPDNGIDDDDNGYIDDMHGWDFVNFDNNPSDYSRDLYGDGHGTHVAGIIAAQGNNDMGITGVMWHGQIMALQIFDLFQIDSFYQGTIQSINIILAIEYAVDNGANIINLSLGGPSYAPFQYDIVEYAHDKGVLIVAAAGNESRNNDVSPTYPAGYALPNILAVASSDENDNLSAFSNFGAVSVDVAAPGGNSTVSNIYSATPPVRATLFSDDFESGASKWVTSGQFNEWSLVYDPVFRSQVAQDSPGTYVANENSYLATATPVNAANCRGLHFEFDIDHTLEDRYDFLYIESSSDGTAYSPLYAPLSGFSFGIINYHDWGSESDIDSFYLRFRLETDFSNNYDGVYLDNVSITAIPWQFTGTEYGYKRGTSMATPVVAGLAGLVWSRNPSLTHIEVKDAILNSVDSLSSLQGKVLTGGRVNAYTALLLAGTPAVFTIQITEVATDITTFPTVNDPVHFTMQAIGPDGLALHYRFFARAGYGLPDWGGNQWVLVQDWSPLNSVDFIFPSAGNYYVIGHVIAAGETWASGDPQGGLNIAIE